MKSFIIIILALTTTILVFTACSKEAPSKLATAIETTPRTVEVEPETSGCPKIANWLAKKDELIASGRPYSLVMTGLIMPEEAKLIREANPDALLLVGLTTNWVWENPDWKALLENVASYGREEPLHITDDMYLRKPNGERCPFGWASADWGQEEIYAMDPGNPEWTELVTGFYGTLLKQPHLDGIIVDMVIETSLCQEAISDPEWVSATREIMRRIQALNTSDKLVIFNSGRDLSEIDAFAEFMDGYLMENFMGEQLQATYEEGLKAAERDFIVIYAVDTDDTGNQDLNKMRLGLTLSLLHDNTYFTYDFGPRDHGQAWWFPEYDADLGQPLGDYYERDGAYWRDFEKGIVVSSPNSDTTVTFDTAHTDITTGKRSLEFLVTKGDGRIFIKPASESDPGNQQPTGLLKGVSVSPKSFEGDDFAGLL